MLRASRRFTQGFFLRLPCRTPFQSRAIHIHQQIPGEAFSSPVVSNTLRAHLFRVSESTVRNVAPQHSTPANTAATDAHCLISCRRAGLRRTGLTGEKFGAVGIPSTQSQRSPSLMPDNITGFCGQASCAQSCFVRKIEWESTQGRINARFALP